MKTPFRILILSACIIASLCCFTLFAQAPKTPAPVSPEAKKTPAPAEPSAERHELTAEDLTSFLDGLMPLQIQRAELERDLEPLETEWARRADEG